MRKVSKKIIAIILILITLIFNIKNIIFAKTDLTQVTILNKGKSELHLQYNNDGEWWYVTTTFTAYEKDGVEYPAYCIEREKPRSAEKYHLIQ